MYESDNKYIVKVYSFEVLKLGSVSCKEVLQMRAIESYFIASNRPVVSTPATSHHSHSLYCFKFFIKTCLSLFWFQSIKVILTKTSSFGFILF